jgi:hypothetical protein
MGGVHYLLKYGCLFSSKTGTCSNLRNWNHDAVIALQLRKISSWNGRSYLAGFINLSWAQRKDSKISRSSSFFDGKRNWEW